MNPHDQLEQAMNEVAAGKRIAYLGPEVSALGRGNAPTNPAALCEILEAQVRAPRRAKGNLWAVAQYIESRKFRATLNKMMEEAFAGNDAGANPIHDWLARVRPPLVVDTWYDDGILQAFDKACNGTEDWGLVQGVSRNGEWIDIFTRTYTAQGEEIDAPNADWGTLIYKPHGVAAPGSSVLVSDADVVEVLTEIDIQRPIPEEVQRRRTGRPFLFLGCRFDDQMLRIFARQIAKRSGENHIIVTPGPLSRMEARFVEDLGATWLDLPAEAAVEALTVPEG
jgi:hypothetical protein